MFLQFDNRLLEIEPIPGFVPWCEDGEVVPERETVTTYPFAGNAGMVARFLEVRLLGGDGPGAPGIGRIEDAQAAYQAVLLDPMAQSTVNVQIVQWKALDLPDAAAVNESPGPVEIVTEDVAPAEENAPSDDSEAGDGE